MEYNFQQIEQKWKAYWKENKVYKTTNDTGKPKYYILDMFPYPSGAGLHVGHPLGYIASDIYARYKKMKGFNVLHPMGFDAFGLPAEQYALETGQHPTVTTEKNIARYKEQLDNIGFCYDWEREVRTSNPNYYKWTQWIFLQLFHSFYDRKEQKARPIKELISIFENEGNANAICPEDENLKFTAAEWKAFDEKQQREILMQYRLAYQGYAEVWWCEGLGTVLANDEVVNGVSERGGFPVERKKMRQWFLRITEYADRLIDSLDKLEWSDAMKEMQRNWIGKSMGAEIQFKIQNSKFKIPVFTTRPDTIFGVDFMVLAPEHELVNEITTAEQKEAVAAYKDYVKSRSERERMAETKKITGEFTGAYVEHPFTKKQLPVWISEYVLAGYGTGAIMAVPSGDSRDHAFAKHFKIPITNIFGANYNGEEAYSAKEGTLENSDFLNGKNIKEAAALVIEELKKKNIGTPKVNYKLRDAGFSRQRYWGEPFPIIYQDGIAYAIDEPQLKISDNERRLPVELPMVEHYKPGAQGEGPLANVEDWVNLTPSPSPSEMERGEGVLYQKTDGGENRVNEGEYLNTLKQTNLPKYRIANLKNYEHARRNRKEYTIAEHLLWQELRNNRAGYKVRRQHPIDAFIVDFVFLQQSLIVEVDGGYHNDALQKENDVERTTVLESLGFKVIRFTNEEIEKNIEKVVGVIKGELEKRRKEIAERINTTSSQNEDTQHVTPSPHVEKGLGVEVLKRETSTMPGYAGSSWYFLRYMDPQNDGEFASRKATDYWREVDLYIGGTEHAVGHLLYSRMWTKALYDLGFIGFDEPFKKLVNQGMIQGNSRFVYELSGGVHVDTNLLDDGEIISGNSKLGITGKVKHPNVFVSFGVYDRVEKGIMNAAEMEALNELIKIQLQKFNKSGLTFRVLTEHIIPHRIDVNIVDGNELNIEEFRNWKNGEYANAEFILEDGTLYSPLSISDGEGQGVRYICGSAIEKMSKSKYNVVNPDDIVAQYGADTFRMYEMFLGPIDVSKPWDTKGIEGVHRFLKKLWRLYFDEQKGWMVTDEKATEAELKILHKTIKKIADDIEKFSFNTSVSQFMICVNELASLHCHKKTILEPLALCIAPFAPHLAEELWHQFGHKESIVHADFPVYQEQYVTESSKNYPIAINGKTRLEMDFPLDAEQGFIEQQVLANENVQKYLEGRQPKKIIFVKGRMINIVV